MGFHVFARTMHPDWFTLRGFRRLGHDAWQADVRVIEGGHVIQWSSHRARLTEVLAGPETVLPEPGLLFQSKVRNERAASLHPGNGLDYETCFEVERCDEEVFIHLCTEASLDANREGLTVSFAAPNRLEPSAISLIQAESRANRLSIHTFHSFPDELAIVRTHSLFECQLALPAR
jgi:hypothetical protein